MSRMVVAVALLTVLLLPPLAAQTHNVTVERFENRTGNAALDALSMAIEGTLRINLRLLAGSGALETAGGTVGGYIARDPGSGEFQIVAEVRDPRTNETIAAPEVSAAGLFAVFEAVDELTNELIVFLAGRRVTYGALTVEVGSADASLELRFTLNGEEIGRGRSARLSTVVTGEYRLGVSQERLEGWEAIYEAPVVIADAQTAAVMVSLPRETEPDRRVIRAIDAQVRAALASGSIGEARSLLTAAQERLAAAAERSGIGAYRAHSERFALWREQLQTAGSPVRSLDATAYRERLELLPEVQRHFRRDQLPIGQRPLTMAGIVSRYRRIPWRTIRIDGDYADWEGVTPLVTKGSGGNYRSAEKPGTWIESVYMAQDEQYYYVHWVIADGPITTSTEPEYKIWIPADPANNGGVSLRVRWAPWASAWQALTDYWAPPNNYRELSQGTVRITGSRLEARFSKASVARWLPFGSSYRVSIDTVTYQHATNSHWVNHSIATAMMF